MIDWTSPATEVLLDPRRPPEERRRLDRLAGSLPPLRGHVWLATSGAAGPVKLVALSKEALLASAAAVNEHLAATRDDVWAHVLPLFHVGGLGILARAHLCGAQVAGEHDATGMPPRWTAEAFGRLVNRTRATLGALVPAQVFDLVRAGLAAPPSVRAVVVGGGALAGSLFRRARGLGWPLLPSYGATELGSQAATASLASLAADRFPDLERLPHLEARANAEGILEFRGRALFTGYAVAGEPEGQVALRDPKVDGWWTSGDLGALEGRILRVTGRRDDQVKIGGETVSMVRLEGLLREAMVAVHFPGDAALVAAADERLGRTIHLLVAAASRESGERLREAYNTRVLPFERARVLERRTALPRSPLGKLRAGRLPPTERSG